MVNPGWYVVYTKPRHEKKVAEELNRRTIDHYLPTVKTLRKWHDRKKYIEAPVFPSYVFLRAQNLTDYYEIAQIDGVVNFVKFGKEVARVSDDIIESIRLVIASEHDLEISTDYFPAGQKFYIQEGPLTGVCCEVVSSGTRQRVLVRVTLLQRNLLVTITTDKLAAFNTMDLYTQLPQKKARLATGQ